MTVPERPKIYHIVHADNLASIVTDGCLWSDASMQGRSGGTVVGMGSIKQRRLGLPVSCHAGLRVGCGGPLTHSCYTTTWDTAQVPDTSDLDSLILRRATIANAFKNVM